MGSLETSAPISSNRAAQYVSCLTSHAHLILGEARVAYTMPQAIKLIDAEGRSCIYVPIPQNGKVVDGQGFMLDPEDE